MATESERALGHPRSPEWHKVEEAHLAREGWCRNCGSTKLLQVHHKKPFHLCPQLELDPTNLITLCEDFKDGVECHLHTGHLGNWKTFNPAIDQVADSPAPEVPATHLQLASSQASASAPTLSSSNVAPPAPTTTP